MTQTKTYYVLDGIVGKRISWSRVNKLLRISCSGEYESLSWPFFSSKIGNLLNDELVPHHYEVIEAADEGIAPPEMKSFITKGRFSTYALLCVHELHDAIRLRLEFPNFACQPEGWYEEQLRMYPPPIPLNP